MKKFPWDLFFKLICGSSALVFLAAIILRLFAGNLTSVKLEYLLLSFGLSIILPYLSQLDAFGVKFELRKKVEDLSEQITALPDYVIGSEYDEDEDYMLAEKYYNSSLMKCNDFWPALLGLASIYDDQGLYEKAYEKYKKVLKIDPENAYALNNLAAFHIYSPWPYYDPEKAIENADQVLEIVPNLNSALYYKGEALNRNGSYTAAYDLLKKLLDSDNFPSAKHDILYELAVAGSNLGKAISIHQLESMLSFAENNNEEERLMSRFYDTKEQKRFDQKDIPIILGFIDKNNKRN